MVGHVLHDLFGDWRELINRFTNHSVDLTDSLIQSLHARRRPGTSHQYLAYLARLNVWHMILTFNFDQFIERAFAEQQLPHPFGSVVRRSIPQPIYAATT